MKTLKYFVIAFVALSFWSCAKADDAFIHDSNQIAEITISGIGDFVKPLKGTIDETTGKILFAVSKKDRPYFPDLSKLMVAATVGLDAKITPSLTGVKDLTSAFKITVTSGIGTTREYELQAYYQRD